MTTQTRSQSAPRLARLGILAGLALALGSCGGKAARPDTSPDAEADVNVGLSALLEEDGAEEPATDDLESLINQQAAQLAEAYGNTWEDLATPDESPGQPPEGDGSETEDLADASLAQMLAEAESTGAESEAPTEVVEAAADPEQVDVETLYARLDEALGRELDQSSEPFRTALAMIALAAAQGRDPMEAIGPQTRAGAALSPVERESAAAVAEMLASVFSDGGDQAGALRELAERLSTRSGVRIPRAVLCTEVRGFGRYTAFPKTDFLAGRPVRALLYVEVEGFEHREVDTENLGGLPVEERWAIEVSQTLELHHGKGEILAWKRPEEVVVETSRNKQRDFYLLTDIQLPPTLTVGSYMLKVIVRDRVSGGVAESLVPIGVVADPSLAWTAR